MSVKLTLIRGLPGSGKSTMARSMNAEHLEADMYFIDNQGNYIFIPNDLPKAHQWCEERCEEYLKHNTDVVVANTFIKQWELQKYRDLAIKYKAELSIIVCDAAYKSIHNVPAKTIAKMKCTWED